MFVFVLSKDKKPLSPCHPARARKLLNKGRAAVYRRYPLTIILKEETKTEITQNHRLKIDPGSRTTGIAILQGDFVKGFQTGDIVKAIVTKGKKIGTYSGRIATRSSGSFNISSKTDLVQGINYKYCTLVHRKDGYSYQY